MPLFIVHHQHSPDTCPARDPAKGTMLLNHLSRSGAARHGVLIKAEAVARASHSLFFIAEATDETVLEAFQVRCTVDKTAPLALRRDGFF
ncbi:hypothetical protein J2Z19_005216 [Ensifer adhaerens]|uniref:Uncharacterized protein n=1 Tax=Ensifer adhaerens TaxID=106592 RepID=A0ACC5T328_ENSAD|nr:hypothetical protein [Ensifer adhaerens]